MSLNKDLKIQIAEDDKSVNETFNYKITYKLPNELTFLGFDSAILDNLKPYLQTQGSTVTLDPKYKQNPELLSYDQYGTPDFWYVILFVNNIFSKINFTVEQIFIPSRNAISYLISNSLKKEDRTIVQTNK